MRNRQSLSSVVLPILLTIAGLPGLLAAQPSGKTLVDRDRGVQFVIPPGWSSQKSDAGFTLTDANATNVLLLLYHRSSTVEDMRQEAELGISEDEVTLSLFGDVVPFGTAGIAAEYRGSINREEAGGYAIGLLAPGGGGVTIVSLAAAEAFGAEQREQAEALARSVRFTATSLARKPAEWNKKLAGVRLLYLSAYTSGTSGGHNQRREINLCADKRFTLSGESVVSVYVPGATTGGAERDQAEGVWNVVSGLGEVILELRCSDGTIRRFGVSERDGKVLLDGTSYMATADAGCP